MRRGEYFRWHTRRLPIDGVAIAGFPAGLAMLWQGLLERVEVARTKKAEIVKCRELLVMLWLPLYAVPDPVTEEIIDKRYVYLFVPPGVDCQRILDAMALAAYPQGEHHVLAEALSLTRCAPRPMGWSGDLRVMLFREAHLQELRERVAHGGSTSSVIEQALRLAVEQRAGFEATLAVSRT